MVRLPDGTFRVTCRNGTSEIRSESEILANRVCTTGGGGRGNFVYGTSDSCDADRIIGAVNETTDCSNFSESDRSWSVRIQGECRDISDTTARSACNFVFSNLPNTGAIFGSSDSCDPSRTIGTVSRNTDCQSFADSGSAWSISYSGQCTDISDTTPRRACLEVRSKFPGAGVIYGTSDSCDSSRALFVVDELTNCNTLSDSERSWSVKIGGQCRDISDTSVRSACFVIQGG
jgi:hypothetical protein